jgi:hypothetical protein
VSTLRWPPEWQAEAAEAILSFVGSDVYVGITVGDPQASIDGSVLAGYLYATHDGDPMVVYDRTDRPDVYPWRLLRGPVLRISVRTDGRGRRVVYTHPEWDPRLRV